MNPTTNEKRGSNGVSSSKREQRQASVCKLHTHNQSGYMVRVRSREDRPDEISNHSGLDRESSK